MIRNATVADIPRLVELGSRSLQDGPYAGMIRDTPEQSARLAFEILESQNGTVLVHEEEDGSVTGLLACFIYPHYFTGEATASELMWYVLPDFRAGGAALKLLWAAEKMATMQGATRMQFTAPTNDVERLYRRFGYKQIEVTFQKDLCQLPQA